MKIERFLSQKDAGILSRLAERLLRLRDVKINSAEQLVDLISNAILMPENARRKDCVSLYSEVTYREVGTSRLETIFLVCPQETDEALARVSILAPVAMALLGRPVGSIAEITLPFKQVKYVAITDVKHADMDMQPGSDGLPESAMPCTVTASEE